MEDLRNKDHEISDSDSEPDKTNLSYDLFNDNTTVHSTEAGAIHGGHAGNKRKSDEHELIDKPGKSQKVNEPVCKYGEFCYRKNPQHISKFHPERGDRGLELINEPFRFMLTKVSGIPQQYNEYFAVGIKDILCSNFGQLQASAQFNFMIEVDWLIQQYPSYARTKPLLLVCGEERHSHSSLKAQIMPYSNITMCQARLEIAYGTHHTKMMILLYDDGLRIVIHTANLVPGDWHQKTQGVWISPLCPKLLSPLANDNVLGDSATCFKRDIMEYVSAYRKPQLKEWLTHLRNHDLSDIKVHLVGSVPGRHTGNSKSSWGHTKLQKILKKDGPSLNAVQTWPVLCQFSSVGSLGPSSDSWLCGEFLGSLATTRGQSFLNSKPKLQVMFPTKDNIRLSLEGYPAGASVPYSLSVAKKQPYLINFMHQWKSEGRGRSRASPHIKTYVRYCPVTGSAAWFLVTSANLSKAAWGAYEKNGSQLMIRSYELGVLFLPQYLVKDDTFKLSSHMDILRNSPSTFPLPYDLPPKPYSPSDKPWIWDIAYTDLPDSHGNIWSPS